MARSNTPFPIDDSASKPARAFSAVSAVRGSLTTPCPVLIAERSSALALVAATLRKREPAVDVCGAVVGMGSEAPTATAAFLLLLILPLVLPLVLVLSEGAGAGAGGMVGMVGGCSATVGWVGTGAS